MKESTCTKYGVLEQCVTELFVGQPLLSSAQASQNRLAHTEDIFPAALV